MRAPTAARILLLAAVSVTLLVADAFATGAVAGDHGSGAVTAADGWPALVAAAVVGLALGACAIAFAAGAMRRERELRALRDDLGELLQASESARESQRLLIEHARRALPGAGAGVLSVDESDEVLRPLLADRADQTPLCGIRTDGLGPRACLAMRLARSHSRGRGQTSLMGCEICGALDAEIACDPLVCSGDVIGTVLVAHAGRIPRATRDALRDAAGRAAPLLAGQRELARAEERAASDALTGLPNRRAADDAIRRMVARAGRTLSPLGVVLLDLDRFRVLNDLHGSTHGDKALAAVGRLLAATIRASDYVARFGGEEFLLVLPDTDRQGCLEVAEKVRRQIEHTELVHTGPITASLGIACLPDDAVDPEQLLRHADRALYMAKAQGRNRVHAAEHSGRRSLPPA
ncbi:MAG: diguanylate cyclase [Solirubrobacteraceae bacterium]